MNNLIELVDNFYWPIKGGKSCREYTVQRHDAPQRISKYVEKKGTIIHAGGNVGYYAKQYAELFNTQYVFEPDFVNFYCLNLNLQKNNTLKIQGILGNKYGPVDLIFSEDSGGHNVKRNYPNGKYPVFKIDDLELKECDLIALDVEGFEEEVIKGAITTISKYHPIMSAEICWSPQITGILSELGYIKIDDVYGDWVFQYK